MDRTNARDASRGPHTAPGSTRAGTRAGENEIPAESARPSARAQAPKARVSRQVPPVEQHTLVLGGQTLSYRLRVSARARRIRLVIAPNRGLELVLPRGATRAQGEAVIREKAAWVFATLAQVAARTPPPPAPLADGQVLRCYGRELRLALRYQPASDRFRAGLQTNAQGQTTLVLITPTRDPDAVRAALERWYRHQARAIFAERVAACNAAYGFTYRRISVKDQKSRWGSCSRQGNLNFNWRLLLAPPAVLDYVVYHELAHLKEHNHAPRFWALVARACPAYEEHRRWLRLHGQELRF